MIHLITSFYILEKNDEISIKRNNELINSLINNINNNIIEKIHLYLDNESALEKLKFLNLNSFEKIHIINIGKQPLYSDLFEYAIDNLNDKICMICNSDIYLYECDMNCLNRLDNNIFALSRYEHDLSCPIIDNHWGSHDAFIFKSPLNKNILQNLNHIQNVAGSDDSVVNNLVDNGYKLYNPCYQIKIIHLHQSQLRTYNEHKIAHGKYFIRQELF